MSLERIATPGKLFLCGEYSVLLGHQALVMTIDRFAVSAYSPHQSMEFWSNTTGVVEKQLPDHPLFMAALKACRQAGFVAKTGKYEVDTRHFFDNSQNKLGLGSSAAALTSLCKLITRQTKSLEPYELFLIAKEANLKFSRGLGSGADIAASCFNSSIHFQKASNESEQIKRVNLSWLWPNICIIHTKVSQNTRDFVAEFLTFAQHHPETIKPFLQRSDEVCAVFSQKRVSFDVLCQAVNQGNELLMNLGQNIGINIVGDPHREIMAIAQKCGGAAKPSGAGGGDISIAVIKEEQRRNFTEKILDAGFNILNLKLT